MRKSVLSVVVVLAVSAGAWWWFNRTDSSSVATVALPDARSTEMPTVAQPAAAWPTGNALEIDLPSQIAEARLTQSLHEDGAIVWTTTYPDGSRERWLLAADGSVRSQDRNGTEYADATAWLAPSAPFLHLPASSRISGLDWLALAGIANAHAENSSNSAPDNRNADNQNGSGGSNQNGAGASNSNGSSQNGGGGSNSNGSNQNGGDGSNSGGSNQNGGGGSNSNGSNQNGGGGSNSGGSNQNGGGGSNSGGSNQNGGAGSNSGGSNQNGGGGSNSDGSNQNGGGGSNSNGSNQNGGGGGNSNGSNQNGGGGGNSNGSNQNGGAGSNSGGSNHNGGSTDAGPASPAPAPQGGGSGQGDPHYVSGDGLPFSTQHAGEFMALHNGADMTLQVRQQPWRDSESVAIISALAIGAGSSRVGIHVLPRTRILLDGVEQSTTTTFAQIALDGGAALGIWTAENSARTVAVMWSDGSLVMVRPRAGWLDFSYQISGFADATLHTGLLGSADGDPGNDFTDRDGNRSDDSEESHDRFIQSWRIGSTESLFDYAEGESTVGFQLLEFPLALSTPDAAVLAAARARCADAGVIEPALLDACAYDLAATGEDAMLASHQAAQSQQTRLQSWRQIVRPAIVEPASTAAFTPDLDSAELIANDTLQQFDIAVGTQRVFAIEVSVPTRLQAMADPMECVDEYDGIGAGYQWFDADGRARSKARMLCSDLSGDEVVPGRYFIVVRGPSAGDAVAVSFKPYLAQP